MSFRPFLQNNYNWACWSLDLIKLFLRHEPDICYYSIHLRYKSGELASEHYALVDTLQPIQGAIDFDNSILSINENSGRVKSGTLKKIEFDTSQTLPYFFRINELRRLIFIAAPIVEDIQNQFTENDLLNVHFVDTDSIPDIMLSSL